jgi:hypothetical protein
VSAPALAPRLLLSSLSVRLGGLLGDREIRRATRLSRSQWRDLGRAFPRLGSDPGPDAALARRRFGFLVGRALADRGDGPVFRDAPPPAEPCLYATAHVGDLRSLRYFLRPRIAIATVIRPPERGELLGGSEHRAFEERVPRDFPHVLSAREPHRLRSALARGSLIVSSDLPEAESAPFPCLGGEIRLDPRPFRLARLAGVPSRPLFLTAPAGRLTITVGQPLPREETAGLAAFAAALARIADESALEIDGFTWWNRLQRA